MSLMPLKLPAKRSREMSVEVLYSSEAEKAVLGCMMAQPAEVINDATVALMKEDFFVPAHQEIFGALREMYNSSQAIDVMTIHQWLTDRKVAEAVGSPGILAELLVGFATHLNVGSYIKIVKEKSLLRCLQSACSTIVQDIAEMPDSVAEVLDRAEASLFKVTRSIGQKAQISSMYEAVARWMATQTKVQLGEVQSRIPTGLREFDALNGGLMRNAVHVFSARPGSGKTDIMNTILVNVAKAGRTVGGIQLEMTEGMMLERFMAGEAGIDSRRFHGPMSLKEWDRLYAAEIAAKGLKFHLACISNLDINGLNKAIRSMVALNVEVLMVDYLQLLKSLESKYGNREQAIAEISRCLSGAAIEHEISIIVGSQLNRLDAGGKQGLANLRESDSIGNDARVVVVLRKADPEDMSVTPKMIVDVVKYSNGATGELFMVFNMPHHRYEDCPFHPQQPLPERYS